MLQLQLPGTVPSVLNYQDFVSYYLEQNRLIVSAQSMSQLGYNFQWLAFGFLTIGAFLFLYLTLFHAQENKRVHTVLVAAASVAAVTYYAMARNQGQVPLATDTGDAYRTFFWARYVEWAVVVPLLIYSMSLLASAQIETTLAVVISGVIMIVSGLLGALSQSSTRWGWFAFACISLGIVLIGIFGNIRKAAFRQSPTIGYVYTYLAFFILATWIAYPVIWVIGEGTRSISVDAEVLLYAILDVLTKTIFGAIFLLSDPIYGSFTSLGGEVLESKLS
mmetsp:Transcript_6258/g.10785  ORF Transcript_6258/g.10785 Transcript_6258/m.10785 type:complete len:277 (-) Transcript_6258:403-1233(-)|eukprot:CAMPEP_0196655314 /NCGR_PEP_ID=MMETSP1086-20130531/5067_1 /TAXON_ID=77921 /ORGANISM="Cyanoptyche  gloeocystis , Strain SAG4.97" /LENGTH=276 /DNA_ID=CAMNT_0041987561 /DNA_START=84 /DNA_END=914 /DNA_ORIENTATION=-